MPLLKGILSNNNRRQIQYALFFKSLDSKQNQQFINHFQSRTERKLGRKVINIFVLRSNCLLYGFIMLINSMYISCNFIHADIQNDSQYNLKVN